MTITTRPRTIGELRDSGYKVLSIKEEMRKNLIEKIRKGEELFPGIIGYEETVIPQIENAILSGQDIIFLGERGQAKTRMARSLVNLLDEYVPIIAGSEINDNPFEPISKYARDKVAELGDRTEIEWIPRERRYGEKLATPDITISDLIGEVDPIRVAEGRYLSDELTIHYGLIPRTNRGIFCINELPDLAERIQVGLLNIMEERDVQIRGYKIRLPLDTFVVASANPEDYTNRGRIITPLKDRIGSQIRTHYPTDVEHEIRIMESESNHFETEGLEVLVPDFMKEVIAEITHLARRSTDISQRSGVSVRVSVANFENVLSNASRRALRLGERQVAPRVSDLSAILASTCGKIELDAIGDVQEERVVRKLINMAILNVFGQYFEAREFDQLLAGFERGLHVQVGDDMPAMEYVNQLSKVGGLSKAIDRLKGRGSPATIASSVEFILEGLHLNRRLNKDDVRGKVRYRR
ncbi:magnesium chelatase subunit I [Thermosporothrix hazakensis]|jgi:magnesium chelatase subunit I|uniref:Magnesium chelatase subunit I n=2 Tax=Thermosporothrix TaxID=768650 RepID=A0A326UCF8_THEHA|nr:magnesium chelatase [Thermosporothrix hazakensis]PZW31959.1 magnesium chelatase subunit I [Thermosporothrix hazakensis]BBH91570.1 magnesium chelatase [Thermosporothrix sp. COM3]GCE49716.1 magnesium chelatase [Thermosporothrix hazakensis]